jgi:hypothetical protein
MSSWRPCQSCLDSSDFLDSIIWIHPKDSQALCVLILAATQSLDGETNLHPETQETPIISTAYSSSIMYQLKTRDQASAARGVYPLAQLSAGPLYCLNR